MWWIVLLKLFCWHVWMCFCLCQYTSTTTTIQWLWKLCAIMSQKTFSSLKMWVHCQWLWALLTELYVALKGISTQFKNYSTVAPVMCSETKITSELNYICKKHNKHVWLCRRFERKSGSLRFFYISAVRSKKSISTSTTNIKGNRKCCFLFDYQTRTKMYRNTKLF